MIREAIELEMAAEGRKSVEEILAESGIQGTVGSYDNTDQLPPSLRRHQMEQAQARALRDAILDQDAEDTVPAAPSLLDTAQALRGLPAIGKGVSSTQPGTGPSHGRPLRGKPRLVPAGKWVHASVLY